MGSETLTWRKLQVRGAKGNHREGNHWRKKAGYNTSLKFKSTMGTELEFKIMATKLRGVEL